MRVKLVTKSNKTLKLKLQFHHSIKSLYHSKWNEEASEKVETIIPKQKLPSLCIYVLSRVKHLLF